MIALVRSFRHARRNGHTRRESVEYALNPWGWL